MAQCIKCGKLFRRSPPHPRKVGILIRNRAKLCPDCRHSAHIGNYRKGRPRKNE